jgi:hypothetical protein
MNILLYDTGLPAISSGPARLAPQCGGGLPDLPEFNERSFTFPQPALAVQHGISETVLRRRHKGPDDLGKSRSGVAFGADCGLVTRMGTGVACHLRYQDAQAVSRA